MYKWMEDVFSILSRTEVLKEEGRDWNAQVVGHVYTAKPFKDSPIERLTWYVRGGQTAPSGTLTFHFRESQCSGNRIGMLAGKDFFRQLTLAIGLDGEEAVAVSKAMEIRYEDGDGGMPVC